MHTALIISKYPPHYILGTIQKKLLQEEIVVENIIHPSKFSDTSGLNYDVIFVMEEMISHSEYYRIKNTLERKGKRFYYLSRKSAGWHWQKEISKMSTPKAVKDSDLPELIKTFVHYRNLGMTMNEVLPHVVQFWINGNPNGKAVHQYMRNLIETKRCPAEFVESLSLALKKRKPMHDNLNVVSNVTSIPEPTASNPFQDVSSYDWEQLANEYSTENANLKETNAKLSKENVSLKSELERASVGTKTGSEALLNLRTKTVLKSMEHHLGSIAMMLRDLLKDNS